ncbi:hypothetical protein FRC08_018824 [Ceratobasidium sp. 394]|nr:hypothetical protein FRC08_018824 [Ceratobasidium sp. 394]
MAVVGEHDEECTESPSKRRRVDVGGKFVPVGAREGAPARGRVARARLPAASRSSGPAPKVVPAKPPPRSGPATSGSKSNTRPAASTSRLQTKVPTPRVTRSTLSKHAPPKASTHDSCDIND